ncbi:MAG: hypothetical protein E7653_00850 [Ruminococcaceae bacterium]|nr:hypothetical protein [Oscillospiraceae bacterium]
MSFLDFNSLIISNNDTDRSSLSNTLTYFKDLGIRRFIVTCGVDPAIDTYSSMLSDIRALRAAAMDARPRAVSLLVVPCVHLSCGVLRNPILKKLSYNGTHIFVQAPLFVDDKWLPSDINYLLYKQNLKPIFVSFERNLLTSDYEFGNKLYKTQSSRFCLDLNFLTGADGRRRVEQAIFRNIPVIPCVSGRFENYESQIRRFEILKTRLGASNYYRLSRTLNDNGKALFT